MIWASTANASGVYVSGDFDSYSQFGSEVIAAPVYAQNDLDFTINGFNYIYFTQPFIAKFDRNGNPLWARNGVSSDLANFRGLATTSDGVWASGFLKITNSIPAQFGTNYVYSDIYIPGGSGSVPCDGVTRKSRKPASTITRAPEISSHSTGIPSQGLFDPAGPRQSGGIDDCRA